MRPASKATSYTTNPISAPQNNRLLQLLMPSSTNSAAYVPLIAAAAHVDHNHSLITEARTLFPLWPIWVQRVRSAIYTAQYQIPWKTRNLILRSVVSATATLVSPHFYKYYIYIYYIYNIYIYIYILANIKVVYIYIYILFREGCVLCIVFLIYI